jgi:hypothetical protein
MNSVLAHDCPPIGLTITFRALPSHRAVPPSRRRSYTELSGGGSSYVSGARLPGAVGGSWATAGVMSFGIAAAVISAPARLRRERCWVRSAFGGESTPLWSHHPVPGSDETWLPEWSGNLGGEQRWRSPVARGVLGQTSLPAITINSSWPEVWLGGGCLLTRRARLDEKADNRRNNALVI